MPARSCSPRRARHRVRHPYLPALPAPLACHNTPPRSPLRPPSRRFDQPLTRTHPFFFFLLDYWFPSLSVSPRPPFFSLSVPSFPLSQLAMLLSGCCPLLRRRPLTSYVIGAFLLLPPSSLKISRAEASYLCSLPPGMEPPDRAELDCLCTYDEMSGPFRKPPPPTAAGAATATTPAASAGTSNSGPTSPTTPTSSQGGSGGVARRENGRKERRGSSQVGPSAKGKGRASDGDDAPTTLELENSESEVQCVRAPLQQPTDGKNLVSVQLKRQLEQLRQLQAFLPQQHRSLPHEYGQGPLPQTRVPYANGSTAAPYHFPPVVPSTHASGYVYPPYGQQPTPQGERAYLWGEPNVVPPSQGSATSPQTQFYPPAPVSFSSRPGSYQGHQGSSNSGALPIYLSIMLIH